MNETIKVTTEWTNNYYKAKQRLKNMPNLVACDFEITSRFSKKEKELMKYKLDNFKLSKEEHRILSQHYLATGLSHPSLTVLTHFSIAWSNHESYVVITDTPKLRNLIYQWLITTNRIILFHNYPFDGKHIYYHTGKHVKNLIDTMLMAKCLLNDANPMKDKVGLKELMSYAYGSWAMVQDNPFTLENMWNEDLLKYTGIDSTALYKLYEDLLEEQTKWRV